MIPVQSKTLFRNSLLYIINQAVSICASVKVTYWNILHSMFLSIPSFNSSRSAHTHNQRKFHEQCHQIPPPALQISELHSCLPLWCIAFISEPSAGGVGVSGGWLTENESKNERGGHEYSTRCAQEFCNMSFARGRFLEPRHHGWVHFGNAHASQALDADWIVQNTWPCDLARADAR